MFRRHAICLVLGMLVSSIAVPTVDAQQVEGCSGIVFLDTNADGELQAGNANEAPEVGVDGVAVQLTDAQERGHALTTAADGRWSAPPGISFPLRVDFTAPDNLSIGPAGPFSGLSTQYITSAESCSGAEIGNLGLVDTTQHCGPDPDLITACFVTGNADDHDQMAAIVALNNSSEDNATTEASTAEDWLSPLYRSAATVGEVGSVYGVAVGTDRTVYAAAFVKRHSRLTSTLNPEGNPSVIYRVPHGGEPEIFATLRAGAQDPHGSMDGPASYVEDLAVMGAVYTSGLGDVQLSSDMQTLFAVDLGTRSIAAIDVESAQVVSQTQVTGSRLGITNCSVTEDQPAGDLRPFGLGLDADGSLLVGVVCSAESTTQADDFPVDAAATTGPSGDHEALWGYVFDLEDGGFHLRLDWPLAGDRGRMQDGGGLAHDAAWHPWVDVYPFDQVYGQVAYPQPAITDIALDVDGDIVIALGDRWGHQTAPRTVAPAWDDSTRAVPEPLSSGDLVRACANGTDDGWAIEGSPSCPGLGGAEHFQDDRYGVHDETAFGSVVQVPGRSGIVATHMNPIPAADTWQSGGLIWHDLDTGRARKGVRLYDGRSADPEGTFEKASGLGGVAVDCGEPPIQLAGSVWHDADADGMRDPSEVPIPGVTMILTSDGGEELARVNTVADGTYLFDNRTSAPELTRGLDYRIVMHDANFDDAGTFGAQGDFVGLTMTLTEQSGADTATETASPLDHVAQFEDEPTASRRVPSYRGTVTGIDHALGFAMTDRYDLALVTTVDKVDLHQSTMGLQVSVRNQGSLGSGAFTVTDELPEGTSLVTASGGVQQPDGAVSWEIAADDQLLPGEERTFQLLLRIDDLSLVVTNHAEISRDSGEDHDSFPDATISGDGADPVVEQTSIDALRFDGLGADLDEDDHDIARVGSGEIGGQIWIKSDGSTSEEAGTAIATPGVRLHLIDGNGSMLAATETGVNGEYAFSHLLPGVYGVDVATSNFLSGEPLAGLEMLNVSGTSLRAIVELAGQSPTGELLVSPSGTFDGASDMTVSFGFTAPAPWYQRWAVSIAAGLISLLLFALAALRVRQLSEAD